MARRILLLGMVWDTFIQALCASNAADRPNVMVADLVIKPPLAHAAAAYNINALQQQGPLALLGMEHLRASYGHIFNFSHRFLYDPQRFAQTFLNDDAANMVAQWWHDYRGVSEGKQAMALLSACARELVNSALLTKELKILNVCSVGNGLNLRDNPERLSVSIYPGTAIMQFLLLLFYQYQWTSITAIIDGPTIERNSFHRGMNDIFQIAFNRQPNEDRDGLFRSSGMRYTAYHCNTRVIHEIRTTFLKITQISRTAHEMNMTNGNYVFIQMTLQKQKLGMNGRVDTSWILSDKTEKLGLQYLVYPAKSVLLLSFKIGYTDESVEPVRRQAVDLGWRQFNFTYPHQQVLNETYSQMGRLLNGPDLVKHFLNRTFDISTGEIYINRDGERMCDILGDMTDDTGTFQTVIVYNHKSDSLEVKESRINLFWPGGRWPPLNEPICGYLGNGCLDETRNKYQILTGCLTGSLLVVSSMFGTAVARRWFRLLELRSSWWVLSMDNLELHPERRPSLCY